MRKENHDNQFEKLIGKIESLEKPTLSEDRKVQLKNQLFSKLNEKESAYDSLISAVSSVKSFFKLDASVKAKIKENVFAAIEDRTQKRFLFSNFLHYSKGYVSMGLVFSIFFGFFSFVSLDTSVARAASFSSIDSVAGAVAIQRDGKFIPAFNGLKVEENDKVLTADNSEVVVKYFDDSINRLSSNTILEINELDDQSSSYVEVSVLDGTVWSKVISLNDVKSAFVMDFNGLKVEADGNAAFNIEIDKGKAEVEVFTSAVEIESSVEKEKVVKGEKLVLDVKNSELGNKKKIRNIEKNDQWVEDNLTNDEIYLSEVKDDLLEEQIKLVNFEVNDELIVENSLREETVLFFTFDDVKKQQIQLEIAEKNFIEAQIKLNDDSLSSEETERIQFVVDHFKQEVKDFYMLIENIEVKDSEYAEELKSYLDTKIIDYKKDLSVITPENPQYEVKEIVSDLEVLTADTQEEVVEIKIEQAEQKIDLLEDIVEQDDLENSEELVEEIVEEIVEDYTTEITEVIEMVDYINEESEIVEDIVEDLKEDIDLLESIEDEINIDLETKEVKSEIVSAVDKVGLDTELIEDKVYIPIVVASPVEENVATEEIVAPIKDAYDINLQGDKVLPPLFK